jgi:hypothetical protein
LRTSEVTTMIRTLLLTTACLLALAVPARAQLYPGGNPPYDNAALAKTLLTSLDPRERAEAARLLGLSGRRRAIEPLTTAAAEDPDRRVRRAASEAIAQIRGERPGNGGGWNGDGGYPGIAPRPPVVVDPNLELVQSWYERFLHRSTDPDGAANWLMLLRRGTSHEEVKAGIIGSEEFYRAHGGTTGGFIRGLYDDVLGRSAGGTEVAEWADQLRRMGGDRNRLAQAFLRASRAELNDRGWFAP